MSDDFEEQIRREFIVEASEMLEAVESEFINLERSSDDLAIIDNIFRMAHSIKGSAFACGFNQLGEFAHSVEMLLVNLREKKLEMTAGVIDTLLKANDCLKELLEDLRDHSGKTIQTAHIVKDIDALIAGKKPSVQVSPESVEQAPVEIINANQINEIREVAGEVVKLGLDSYIGLMRTIQKCGNGSEFAQVIGGFEVILAKVRHLHDIAVND